MKLIHRSRIAALIGVLATLPGFSQTFPTPGYFRDMVSPPAIPAQLPGPEDLRDYVLNGKLRLTLTDAIRLTLLNNTEVRLDQLPVDQARFALQRVYQPFDPQATSRFSSTRFTTPTSSQLQGAPTLSELTQQTGVGYQQTFQTGTQFQSNFNASKASSNSRFVFFNPSISSTLSFSLAQPLLRNRGLFVNRAPIVIAQRNLKQSRAVFEAQVNDAIAQAVGQYWEVVSARGSLDVQRRSLEAAEATYKHDKRALELGALSPLEIYRSESQVAQRRVQVIQVEYALKQAEDRFRRTIGADLDPYIRPLDLDLAENVEPTGELFSIDGQTALERAFARRPDLEALKQQLENDDTAIRVARNGLEPDLTLSALYSSSGLGGNQFDTTSTPPVLVSRGGFSDALSQVVGFGFPTYGFSVQLNFPVRNRAAEANLGSALVSKRRGLYLMRQLQQAITLDVTNAVHQLEQSKLSLDAAKIARDLAQKTMESEQRKYELGVGQIFLVLEAQTELAQAELNVVQAEVGYQRAVTEVEHTTGGLLDRYHVQIAAALHQ